jgi:Concanavalin A-like lectin/glucanases superfamily/Cadherin-like domain
VDDGTPQTLSIISYSVPQSGSITQTGGTLTYTPNAGFLGEDHFTYTITDGGVTSSATITISVVYVDTNYWFPLDETTGLVAEEAGGYKTASLNAFATNPNQWIEGHTGRGLNFDGVDDVVTIDGFTGILGTNARTITAWVKTTATGSNRPIVAWGPNSVSNKWTFLMNTVGQIRLEVGSGLVIGTTAINDGVWHHVACVLSGSNVTDVKLYVDGALETPSSTTALAINTTASGNVKIGSDIQDRFWRGGMDDVRIYPRALSAAEITAQATGRRHAAEAWQKRHYGPTAASWAADTDGDGLSTLMEFALGKQPQLPDGSTDLTMTLVDLAAWEVNVRQRAASFGLQIKLERSTDLTVWTSTNVTADNPIPDGADKAFEFITYSFPNLTPKQFCRIQAMLP